ncbi:hypothetical protein V6Z12_A13G124900 [Gossypium hirsutum]
MLLQPRPIPRAHANRPVPGKKQRTATRMAANRKIFCIFLFWFFPAGYKANDSIFVRGCAHFTNTYETRILRNNNQIQRRKISSKVVLFFSFLRFHFLYFSFYFEIYQKKGGIFHEETTQTRYKKIEYFTSPFF